MSRAPRPLRASFARKNGGESACSAGDVYYEYKIFENWVVWGWFFFQSLKKKKKAEGKLSEKEEMSQKEKEIFEAQLMKEAEIRDRLKEASSPRFSVSLFF